MAAETSRGAPRMLLTLSLLAVLLLGLGAWQLGGAVWIYAKARVAQVLLEQAWVTRLTEGEAAPPWPWADTHPVARLSVPALGVDQIVLAGATGRTLAFGPAHVDGSALPGEAGHAILTGHRDTHFGFLERLEAGALLWVQRADGAWQRYRVAGSEVLDSRKAEVAPDAGRPVLSLVTCWPFDAIDPGTPWRYVVTAEAVTEVAAGD